MTDRTLTLTRATTGLSDTAQPYGLEPGDYPVDPDAARSTDLICVLVDDGESVTDRRVFIAEDDPAIEPNSNEETR